MNLKNYIRVASEERFGAAGRAGIQVLVDIGRPLTHEEAWVAQEAAPAILNGILALANRADPEKIEQRQKMVDDLLGCFPYRSAGAWVEIPNGYCREYCCTHRPWLRVATLQGYITLGWRKRVIHLDWGESLLTKNGNELFAKEDVTKGTSYIHAWGYGKATEYLAALLAEEVP